MYNAVKEFVFQSEFQVRRNWRSWKNVHQPANLLLTFFTPSFIINRYKLLQLFWLSPFKNSVWQFNAWPMALGLTLQELQELECIWRFKSELGERTKKYFWVIHQKGKTYISLIINQVFSSYVATCLFLVFPEQK